MASDRSIQIDGRRVDDIRVESINLGAAGTHTVVSAPGSNKRIVLLGYMVAADGSVTFSWEDEEELSGPLSLINGTPMTTQDPNGLLICAENRALKVQVSGGRVGGHFKYAIVEDIT